MATATNYYKISYPPNLKAMITDFKTPRYSQGWYGTCSFAPAAATIDCYDDAAGFCLCSFVYTVGPNPLLPSGMQDGTVMTLMSQSTYQTLLAQEIAKTTDGSNGVWTSTVLTNRNWNYQPPSPYAQQMYNDALDKVVNG